MNRRSFLTLAGLGAAGMVLDPERLLWVPGKRTYIDLGPFVYRTAWGDWHKSPYHAMLERWVMTTIPAHGYHPTQMYGVSIYTTAEQWQISEWSQVNDVRWQREEVKLMAQAKAQLDDKVRRSLLKRNVMTYPMT